VTRGVAEASGCGARLCICPVNPPGWSFVSGRYLPGRMSDCWLSEWQLRVKADIQRGDAEIQSRSGGFNLESRHWGSIGRKVC